jgi:hypothetical protein
MPDSRKTIYLPTNHNNKLACEAMLHIDLVPRNPITDSIMDSTIVEIRTQDNSYPSSEWKLIDLARIQLQKLPACITMPSHGMYSFDFVKWFLDKNNGLALDTEVAVYFYMRMGKSG